MCDDDIDYTVWVRVLVSIDRDQNRKVALINLTFGKLVQTNKQQKVHNAI